MFKITESFPPERSIGPAVLDIFQEASTPIRGKILHERFSGRNAAHTKIRRTKTSKDLRLEEYFKKGGWDAGAGTATMNAWVSSVRYRQFYPWSLRAMIPQSGPSVMSTIYSRLILKSSQNQVKTRRSLSCWCARQWTTQDLPLPHQQMRIHFGSHMRDAETPCSSIYFQNWPQRLLHQRPSHWQHAPCWRHDGLVGCLLIHRDPHNYSDSTYFPPGSFLLKNADKLLPTLWEWTTELHWIWACVNGYKYHPHSHGSRV